MTADVIAQTLGTEGVAWGGGKFLGTVMKLMGETETFWGLPQGCSSYDWTQLFLASFIQALFFFSCSLSTCCVPGLLLCTGDSVVNSTGKFPSSKTEIHMGHKHKNRNIC